MLISSRYQQDEQIGEGAMGVVYRGVDTRTGQPIVLKKLKPEIADADMIERFRREGEALRRLNHPNIVKMLDAVEANGSSYLILEYIPGGTLRDLLDRQPQLSLEHILNIAVELSDALSRAHHLKIVHRDLKPANILMAADGTPRLTDFGIARIGASKLTERGVISGTFAYLPPEAFGEAQPSPLFDIWAFGVVLYEMLTGALPFPQKTLTELFSAVTRSPIPRIEDLRPDAPIALIDLIHRMLEKDPRSRIPSARLIGAELEAITTGTLDSTTITTQTAIDTTIVLDRRFQTPTPVTSSKVRHNLPAQTTPFVGRENELAELERLVSEARLVTIFAQGGMGKTRLSLEVGGRFTGRGEIFPDGVFFIELAPVSSPRDIPATIAEAVNYPFQPGERTMRQQLLDYFSDKRLLLIVDNFEHVIEGAELINAILEAAPGVRALVTSRVKLNLSGENVFTLNPMDFPDWETPADALNYSAVKLFMQSAARAQPGFSIGADDLPYIARICRLVEGLPLGILLAAGWLDVLSVREIADEIQASINFLETERRDFPERQRSIRAVFDYSWGLLTPAEQSAFMGLSVFCGSFTREAAQAVSQTDLRALQGLVNKSLIRRNAASGRFEVHELLRQYAGGQLEESGNGDAIGAAHSRYYLTLAAKLTPKLKGEGQLVALNTIEADTDNLRSAWVWAVNHRDAEAVSSTLEPLMLYTTFRSRMEEGRMLVRMARAVWNDDSALAGKLLVRYADEPLLDNFRKGLALAERYGDAHEIAYCTRMLGYYQSHTLFDHARGISNLLASVEQFQALGDPYYAAVALDDLGWSYNLTGQREAQLAAVQDCMAIRRALGDKIGLANALRNMGGAMGGFDGRLDRAHRYWAEAKVLAAEMGDRLGVLWNTALMAASFFAYGDFESAHRDMEEALPLATELNDPVIKGFLYILEGMLTIIEERDTQKAEHLFELGFPPGTPPDFRFSMLSLSIGLLAAETNDLSRIMSLSTSFVQVFGGFVQARPDYVITAFMPIFAVAQWLRGNYELAAQILSARLQQPNGGWVHHWQRLKELQTELRAALGDAAFDAAWEAGKQADILALSQIVIQDIVGSTGNA